LAVAAAALLIILAGSIGVYRLFVAKMESAVPFQAMASPRKLTTHRKVGIAAILPDANYVTYFTGPAQERSNVLLLGTLV